ncbi:hypothetical protein PI95_019960 [Hassallia byssoidea VB512170]|uniref:Uncharacterized protein n=1 Tax=Hassallia byssoidea VB512170 TaxID=1304833 RepID=A0A846HAZ1_9CYAN|nr:hypothetical protein [Hassalia byssoidea]NEU74767.1 hypothetical protein [Hassalia byssoidea VB512170]
MGRQCVAGVEEFVAPAVGDADSHASGVMGNGAGGTRGAFLGFLRLS